MAANSTEYDVIVIGAGPNGLTCGAYLAKAGAKTLLLEKKWETGGGLCTDDFQTPFRFNLHAIYMMLADWAPCHDDLELKKHNLSYLTPETQIAGKDASERKTEGPTTAEMLTDFQKQHPAIPKPEYGSRRGAITLWYLTEAALALKAGKEYPVTPGAGSKAE